jgi:hypothetical protein
MPPQQANHLLDLIDGRLNFRAHRNLFFIVAHRLAMRGMHIATLTRAVQPPPTRGDCAARITAANAA